MKFDIDKFNYTNDTQVIEILKPERLLAYNIPFFLESVSAGFPSPADDYMEGKLDLNELLVKNPPATFFVRVTGDSMTGAGIHSGDILVVDKSIDPKNSSIIIAVINGELMVKRLVYKGCELWLYPENPNYKPVKVTDGMDFDVWGVVRSVIHSVY
jgi:DNA polymerase V